MRKVNDRNYVVRERRGEFGTMRLHSSAMQTHTWVIGTEDSSSAVGEAAALLREGKLVAFPTETVYGLGADGLNADAVARIYQAKGRPATNPVILHVASIEQAKTLTSDWSDLAEHLVAALWPGPLTLILPKSDIVPRIVTAGGPTVAIRMPAHELARSLIEAAGTPLAAPSANRSGGVSPTTAGHVLKTLDGRIDGLIDSGPTHRGLESTVLDLSVRPPVLRRPGPITRMQIERIIGPILLDESVHSAEEVMSSPGMMASHYAPHAEVMCSVSGATMEKASALKHNGKSVACILRTEEAIAGIPCIVLPDDPEQYGALLYSALHELDTKGTDYILIELPPQGDEWYAVRDRLLRASAPR